MVENRPKSEDPGAKDCPICKGLGVVRNDISDPHHAMFGKLSPCECRSEEIAEHMAEVSGMRDHELERRLDDIDPLVPVDRVEALKTKPLIDVIRRENTAGMIEVARRFVHEPWGWLTFWGPYGNGKTHVLQAIVNEFRTRYNLVGTYVTFADLLDAVRVGFEDSFATADRTAEKFRNLPILAIDEVDAARMTEYAQAFRRQLLDNRYRDGIEQNRFTVFAMNSDPKSLPGDLYSRMRDGRFVIYRNRDDDARPGLS